MYSREPAARGKHRLHAWRVAGLLAFVLGTLAWVLLLEPMRQDPAYHLFADRRGFLGIPNFLDVLSNLPFLLIGFFGMGVVLQDRPRPMRMAWLIFFLAVAAVGVGSAYYHLAPSRTTLLWDRLPMTTAFMALFAVLLGAYFGSRWTSYLLLPAVALGGASILVWQQTDDLRLYAWVQFMPLGMIALLLLLFPDRFAYRRLLCTALGCYLVAKLLEYEDQAVFRLLHGTVSGHTGKHLFAAAGCLLLLQLYRRMAAAGLGDHPARTSNHPR